MNADKDQDKSREIFATKEHKEYKEMAGIFNPEIHAIREQRRGII